MYNVLNVNQNNEENNLENITIDSREIAEMGETTHYDILRKLEGNKDRVGIIPTLAKHQMVVSDFFIESTYLDSTGKQNKCYLFTKKGCEFISNKFTGEKGILFTARYVEAFNKMENNIKTMTSIDKPIHVDELKNIVKEMKDTLEEVKSVTMVLNHKQKLNLTKNIIHPKLELYGIKDDYKRKATKVIKDNLTLDGKWENVRADDKFDINFVKNEVDKLVLTFKENNPIYFYNSSVEMVTLM